MIINEVDCIEIRPPTPRLSDSQPYHMCILCVNLVYCPCKPNQEI